MALFKVAISANLRRSSMLSRAAGNRPFATSTTVETASASHHHSHHKARSSWAARADYAPIYMVMGMVVVAVSIGVHTAKQQLLHSPSVKVTKKKRETMSEVEDPDATMSSGYKFINKSFLRKVAHIQDTEYTDP